MPKTEILQGERPWVIYALGDPRTDKIRYVGITFRERQRFNEHLSKAKKGGGTHRDCWIRLLLSLEIRPTITILERGFGPGWTIRERHHISVHRVSGNLVNLTDGGEGTPGCIPSEDLRRRWSENRKGKPYQDGRRSGMLGKKHSQEALLKITASSTGRRHGDKAKALLSLARSGKPLSAEHINKLSLAKVGRSLPLEHKRKISLSTRGRVSVRCLENGHLFPSVTAAASAMGVTESSINQAIRKGCRCRGLHWEKQ